MRVVAIGRPFPTGPGGRAVVDGQLCAGGRGGGQVASAVPTRPGELALAATSLRLSRTPD